MATAGVEPRIMGIGPVPATRKLMERTGMKVEDFDVIDHGAMIPLTLDCER